MASGGPKQIGTRGAGSSGRRPFSALCQGNLGNLKGNVSLLKALARTDDEEDESSSAPLDAPLRALSDELAGLRAELQKEVEAKLREYDLESCRAGGKKTSRSFVEHYCRHSFLGKLRDVIKSFYDKQKEEMDKESARHAHESPLAIRALENPNIWKVTGGDDRRDLIVRTGPSPSWPKLEKLAVGSWIQEEEIVEDRIRFILLWGNGPPTGWVTVTLHDDILAVKVEKPPLWVQGKIVRRGATHQDLHQLEAKGMRQISHALFGRYMDHLAQNSWDYGAAEKGHQEEDEEDETAIDLYHGSRVVSAAEAARAGEDIVVPQKGDKDHISILGVLACNVRDEAALGRFEAVLRTVDAQELKDRSADFLFVFSWYAPPGFLSVATHEMLTKFDCRLFSKQWVSLQQSSSCSRFEHYRDALEAGEGELRRRCCVNAEGACPNRSIWVVFGDEGDLWHHRRVDSYVKAVRTRPMLEGVAALASVGHVEPAHSSERSAECDAVRAVEKVDDLLRQETLVRTDQAEENKEIWRRVSEAGAKAYEVEEVMDLPLEHFDFCPRLRIATEYVNRVSEALLAHRHCDLNFVKFLRSYATHGKEAGLEVAYFKPVCWMYFYANPTSLASMERSIMDTPMVLVRTSHDSFLCVDEDGVVVAAEFVEASGNQEFVWVANDDGSTSLLSLQGGYISASEDGLVRCVLSTRSGAEDGDEPAEQDEQPDRFDLMELGGGSGAVSLWSHKFQAFLVVDRRGQVKACEPEPSGEVGRKLFLEPWREDDVDGSLHGEPVTPIDLRSSEVEWVRQEYEVFARSIPALTPEKLARRLAVLRSMMEASLIEFHRRVFDQREFDGLVLQVAHAVFKDLFRRIHLKYTIRERNKVAKEIYEVCQRFARSLATKLDVQVRWHNCEMLLVPTEQMMRVWNRYRKEEEAAGGTRHTATRIVVNRPKPAEGDDGAAEGRLFRGDTEGLAEQKDAMGSLRPRAQGPPLMRAL